MSDQTTAKPERLRVKRMDEMIGDISHKTGIDRKTVLFVLRGLRDDMLTALKDGQIYRLLDLGNFRMLEKPARKVRNPRTQEVYQSTPSFRVKFSIGNGIDAVVDSKLKGESFPLLVTAVITAAHQDHVKAKEDKKDEKSDAPPAPAGTEADELAKLLQDS